MKQRQANLAPGKIHDRTPALLRGDRSGEGAMAALKQGRREAIRDADLLDLQRSAGNGAVSAALAPEVSDQLGASAVVQRQPKTAVAPQTKKAGPTANGSGVARLLGNLIPNLLPLIPADQLDALQRRYEVRASNAAAQKRYKALLKERAEGGWYYETAQGTAQVSDKAEAWERKVKQVTAKLKPEPEGPDQFTLPTLFVLDPGILNSVPTGDEEAERTFRLSMWNDLIRFPTVTGTLTERGMSAYERSKLGEDAPWTTPDVLLESGRRKFPHTKGIITFDDLTAAGRGAPFAKKYQDEVTNRPDVVELKNAVLDLDEAVANGKLAHEALTEAGKEHPWVKSISEWLGGPGLADYIALARDVKKHPEKGTLEERQSELEAPEPPLTIWTPPGEQLTLVSGLIKTRQIKLAVIRLMVAQKMVQVVLDRFERYQHRVMKGAGTAVTALEVAKAAGKAAAAYLTGGGWLKLGLTARAATAGAYSFAQGAAGNVGAYFFAPTEAKNWGAIGKQAGIDAAVELLGGTLESKFKATLETRLGEHLKAYPEAIRERVLDAASKATATVYKTPAEAVLKHFVAGEKLPGSVEELADKIAEEALKDGAFGLFLSEKQQVAAKAGEVLVKSKNEGEAK